jgi:predicted nucleic acid-binding protein
MVLVDTSVWIDYFGETLNPKVDYLDQMLDHKDVLVGDLVMIEVLQGIRLDRDFRIVQRSFSVLEHVSLVDPFLAVKCAQNNRTLRRLGVTVRKTTDCVIATWCIENHVPLLHSDRDFETFEKHLGLVVL